LEIVTDRRKGQSSVLRAIEIVKGCEAIDYSFNISEKYLGKAKKQLDILPNIKTKRTLQRIADFINIRRY